MFISFDCNKYYPVSMSSKYALRRMLILVIGISSLMVLSTACNNENTGTHTEVNFSAIQDILVLQIDWELDDYLGHLLTDEISNKDVITLKSIESGDFSEPNEFLAAFHIDTPHTGGLDRTIATIVDGATMEIKSQKTFAADNVNLHIIQGDNTHILFISDVTYTGMSTYFVELYELRDNQWTQKDVFNAPLLCCDQHFYSFSNNNNLHVFSLSYDGFMNPSFVYEYTYYWDYDSFTQRIP